MTKPNPETIRTGVTERYGAIAPWATEAARQWAKEHMPDAFERGGLRIETTVLPALAHQAGSWASQQAMKMRNEEEESAQIGIVLFDHQSGYIEVLVGGTDWQKNKFNRAMQSCRQPGSAFKPIVYGAALEAQVITPATPPGVPASWPPPSPTPTSRSSTHRSSPTPWIRSAATPISCRSTPR